MRLGLIAAADRTSRDVVAKAVRFVRTHSPESSVRTDLGPPPPELAAIVGDSRFLLDALPRVPPETAVLAVGPGFLGEVSPTGLEDAIRGLLAGEYWVEERVRLEVIVGDRKLPPALNEVLLTSARGGGFLRYALEVDGERIWRDAGDGIVIATPTGSTGYGLSAGGPVVMENAEALVIAPICSATGHKPLILPRRSDILVCEIESRHGRDLVLDGGERFPLKAASFHVRQAERSVRFVRFGKARYLRVFEKLHAKREHPLPPTLPPSAKFLYRILEEQGPLTPRQLVTESGLPDRTVRNALSALGRTGLVRRAISLRDAREALYALSR